MCTFKSCKSQKKIPMLYVEENMYSFTNDKELKTGKDDHGVS